MQARAEELDRTPDASRPADDRSAVESVEPGGAWHGSARTLRSSVLGALLVLLVLAVVLSGVAAHSVLTVNLGNRIDLALQQEVAELNRFLSVGRDPTTGLRFTALQPAFDVYFARNVPSDEEALLAFVDGELYRSTLARFPLDEVPAFLVQRFAAPPGDGPADPARDTFESELGTVHFRALPVQLGQTSGTFVVAILPVREMAEIRRLQAYGATGVLIVLLLAAAAAWLLLGRVLVPVRQLTETARSISRANLAHRIPVQGADEAAEMARTFNAMLDRIEDVLETERGFIRDASHELRAPLTICLGHLSLVDSGVLDEDLGERARTLAVVSDELERMGRIVQDLQFLADMDNPAFLRLERVDLGRLTDELRAKAAGLAPRRWSVDHRAVGSFVADRHRLTEAVINLAHNAVEHTVDEDELAVGTALDGEEVRIWVRDTGVGVDPADAEHIFDRFRRGTGAERRYRGSGVGLAIVRKVAEVHGGRVELDSTPGEGATFTLVLPRRPRTG